VRVMKGLCEKIRSIKTERTAEALERIVGVALPAAGPIIGFANGFMDSYIGEPMCSSMKDIPHGLFCGGAMTIACLPYWVSPDYGEKYIGSFFGFVPGLIWGELAGSLAKYLTR